MWFLNFIPTELLQLAIHGVVALGVILSLAGAFASRVAFIGQYGIAAKVLGSVLLLLGVFFEGGYGVEMSNRLKMEEQQARTEQLQAEIATAEKKSDDLQKQLSVKSKQKTIIIKEKVVENAKEIEEKRIVINNGCTISDDAWMFYNRAVAPKIPDSTR
jgi:preprotein translocase subunit SecF